MLCSINIYPFLCKYLPPAIFIFIFLATFEVSLKRKMAWQKSSSAQLNIIKCFLCVWGHKQLAS